VRASGVRTPEHVTLIALPPSKPAANASCTAANRGLPRHLRSAFRFGVPARAIAR